MATEVLVASGVSVKAGRVGNGKVGWELAGGISDGTLVGASAGSNVSVATGIFADKFPSAVASVKPPKITVMEMIASRIPIPICRKDSMNQAPSGGFSRD